MTFDRKFAERDDGNDAWDEPVDKSKDQVNVTLDPAIRELVNKVKDALDIKSDSKAMKVMIEIGGNAMFGVLSSKTLNYLCSKDRVRKSDYNKKGELK